MGGNHDHHDHHHQTQGKNLLFSILLNILITVSQAIGGFLSGSLSLLSDALHNFSDVLSLIFSYIANKLSKRRASLESTFGYKRAEVLAAFINAATLIIVALFLIYEAIHRFINPQPIESNLVIWLSILGIAANGLSVLLLKKDSESILNMKSAYLHLFTDMLASIAVLVGGLLMKYFSWFWVDSALTLAIALYLIVVGYDLLKKSTQMLMLFTPKHIDINAIVNEVENTCGSRLYHIHLWHLNDNELHLEAHLDCNRDLLLSEFQQKLIEIKSLLQEKYHINHVTIQPEHRLSDNKNILVQD